MNAERRARFQALAEEHYDAYALVHDEITAAGGYPYNESFRGRIPGIVHLTADNPGVQGDEQDAVIYEMQQLRARKAMQVQVDAFVAEGAEPLTEMDGTQRFVKLMEYGFYVGGTGVRVREDVRVVPNSNGRPTFVIPKGKRTRGYVLAGSLLALKADGS